MAVEKNSLCDFREKYKVWLHYAWECRLYVGKIAVVLMLHPPSCIRNSVLCAMHDRFETLTGVYNRVCSSYVDTTVQLNQGENHIDFRGHPILSFLCDKLPFHLLHSSGDSTN